MRRLGMKKLALIFTAVFFVSLMGFGIAAAASGVQILDMFRAGEFRVGWVGEPYDVNKTIDEDYDSIDIDLVSTKAEIRLSPDDKTRVVYNGVNSNVRFRAEVLGDTLVIEEKINWLTSWGFFSSGTARLELEVPQRLYDEIRIDIVSGRVNAEFPETRDFNLQAVSGSLNISGLTGSGKVDLVSGSATLEYAEWNGRLSIELVSGSANVTLPRGSGAELSFSRVSGYVKYDFDGADGRLDRSTSGITVGSGNVQKLDVELVSGNVTIQTE